MDFMIIADEAYSAPLKLSVGQIGKLYPDSAIYLYDWGLSEKTKLEIAGQFANVRIEDWAERIDQKRTRLRYHPHRLLRRIGKGRNSADRFVFENILIEKVAGLKDCLERFGPDYLCWIDADVVIVDSIEDLKRIPFDVLFTVRPSDEISFRRNQCQVLNVGVVVLGPDRDARGSLVDAWLEETATTREYCREQTAITRLIERKKGREIFVDNVDFAMELDAGSVNVSLRPCQIYNYNWVERLVEKNDVEPRPKLLHFKGGRHISAEFDRLTKELSAAGWF